MNRLACLALLAACGGAPPRSPTPGHTTTVAADTPTVLLLAQGDQAVPLACADTGGRPAPATGCTTLVAGDRTAARVGGATVTLGVDATWSCDASGESAPALTIPPLEPTGALTDSVIVWPAARAADVRVWQYGPPARVDAAALQAAWIRAFPGLEADARPLGTAAILGVLTADLDGDDRDDAIYTVYDDVGEEGEGRRALLGDLSSRPGELATLATADLEQLVAFAAIDLDRDGKDEVVVAAPYYEGEGTSVYALSGGTLEAVGGVFCGL